MNNFSILTTNARSLRPKIQSLLDYMNELEVSVALILETWLKDNNEMDRLKDDTEYGHDVGIIAKHRPRRKNDSYVAGGGVAILYNKQLVALKEYTVCKNNFEVVTAVGKLPNIKNKLIIISAYAPPRLTASQRDGLLKLIGDIINKAKRYFDDPFVVLGGDFNQTHAEAVTDRFADIKLLDSAATWGTHVLDKILTNLPACTTAVKQPLESQCGTRTSDHRTLVVSTFIQNIDKFTIRTVEFRKYTKEGQHGLDGDPWTK